MSHPGQSIPPSPNLSEGYPVASLTLVVLLLIPAVVVLLLLNCLFLGYKLLLLLKARPRTQHREDAEELLQLESTLRARTTPEAEGFSTRRAYMSLSEPVLPQPPVTSSRASLSGREHEIWLLRPGSGSLRPLSSIRAAAAASASSRAARASVEEWRHSAPVLPPSSESEGDARGNLAPPNSPTSVYKEAEHVTGIRRSSTYGMLNELSPGALHQLDQAHMECQSHIHTSSEGSCPNTSVAGSGLDSDFGASAGVSLRILSADSDGFSNGVLASALEWDYYDPCYVKQNHVPKHKYHRPAMHTKQYWV